MKKMSFDLENSLQLGYPLTILGGSSNCKKFHTCKWIFFAISTYAIIEEIAAGYRHNPKSSRQEKIPFNYYLAPEHSGELFADALEQFLNGSCVSNEGSSHFQTTGWDVTNGSLDVVGDPFNEVRAEKQKKKS